MDIKRMEAVYWQMLWNSENYGLVKTEKQNAKVPCKLDKAESLALACCNTSLLISMPRKYL